MRKVLIWAILIIILTASLCFAGEHSFVPKNGFVPDEKTAIAIAEAVWAPIYGEKKIANEKPFKAKLKDGTWTVEGSLPKLTVGGVAVARISQKDGCILSIGHGK
jgi:NTF2 fold immunity protein